MDIQNEIDKMLRKGQIDEAILRLNEQIQATATLRPALLPSGQCLPQTWRFRTSLELLFRGHGH
jgi:hypothetical protein